MEIPGLPPFMTDRNAAREDRAHRIQQAVQQLYDTYPFPPEPLLDEPPPGYNWRWSWVAAHSFCSGRKPQRQAIRILDAGCGTGVGSEYLAHLNPQAQVLGIDISERALAIARQRCHRSGAENATFQALPLERAAELAGPFDFINCVGVLHHLPDPGAGLQALAAQLAPGGLLHAFVYAELGRWEIGLAREAIALLQGDRQDYREGLELGRQLFATLPEDNRLARHERERWSLDNQRDACFADMYLHPQAIEYNIETLFELVDRSGLRFAGFSNPEVWQLERLVGQASALLERGRALPERQRYRLIELLDPDIAHYEFFLAQPPLPDCDWANGAELLAAVPERHPCLEGWPSQTLFDRDYQLVRLNDAEYAFLRACEANPERGATVADLLAETELDAAGVRSLLERHLLVLSPGNGGAP